MNTDKLVQDALSDIKGQYPQYTYGDIKITSKVIPGTKVGYAGGFNKGSDTITGYIVIDSRFCEYANQNYANLDEFMDVVKHELAHLIAETFNTKKKTAIWHGAKWKDVYMALGGNGDRYYKGSFVKPENVGKTFKTKEELYNTVPTEPATNWERGTYRQWLERGYHVIKGQKGQLQVWEFSADEYETSQDGKTSKWGRASAVYFDNTQVEANVPKEAK